jgi:Pentapeptide repeats (8 copies)
VETGALRADCGRCFALCCVAPAFSASADFAIDKPAGTPCPNLAADFRCGIHDRLRPSGFAGCTVYDCFGAGQQVAQVTFGGQDWRGTPELAGPMFAAFAVMRPLHELLWYLTEALSLTGALALPAAAPLSTELREAIDDTVRLTGSPAEALVRTDVAAHRGRVNGLLSRASELARSVHSGPSRFRGDGPGPRGSRSRGTGSRGAEYRGGDYRGADLIGRDLSGADLRGANLRGAYLIGANLAWADLTGADVTGADPRGADVRGADLTGALFLTQSQLDAAAGDATTRLPSKLHRPAHWT